jgi:hypothetical protein
MSSTLWKKSLPYMASVGLSIAGYIASQFTELVKSVQALNLNMAVVVTEIKNHDVRIRHLEEKK